MSDIYIDEVSKHIGTEVTIKGWLYNKRSSGKLRFLTFRDGTGLLQGVMLKGEVDDGTFSLYDELTQESSLKATGIVRSDPRAPGGHELGIRTIEPIQIAAEYPITPKEHGVAFLMDHRHLWLRSSKQHAVLRVRDEVIRACRDFFTERGFVLVDAPIFTPAPSEGTTTLFETGYFDGKAYLTQSGQLYNEATAMAFGRVYCFGPTFRAEKSKTRRHLTEFWMVEPEMAFYDLEDTMVLAEDFIIFIVQRVLENRQKELAVLERDLEKLSKVGKPFPRITYGEAVEILKDEGKDFAWGQDFGAKDEETLSLRFDRPVIIHRYPLKCKAFYMKTDPQNSKLALCLDVLAPEGYGEIIGGGQREDSLRELEAKIKKDKLPMEAFQWYLDLRRYGSVPHAGFGLGIERTVTWICGRDHLREAIPFPRMLYRIYP
ncbi:MAG: asparagine--tRNA ligase [candidate division Zixibacteria bacterium SM23_81]|nr:MAG: asparagine--tRNA ligase [candidate division Zixibacteria bacterium SM23_81]